MDSRLLWLPEIPDCPFASGRIVQELLQGGEGRYGKHVEDPRQWKLLHWASQPPTEDPLLHARMDLSSGKQENQRLRREASSEVSNTAQVLCMSLVPLWQDVGAFQRHRGTRSPCLHPTRCSELMTTRKQDRAPGRNFQRLTSEE
ncbi:hypothetical protein Y1Q_0005890 [Alligator mississippiensis]|uniref:Uncharacterized protein n=1 Tax=Alligator mississippiensis TaxID=8496 RepID=A0A151M7E5_ALLMI|nr:hypothetical protein Y1Q_0005890 [Alligator mississippiensis]